MNILELLFDYVKVYAKIKQISKITSKIYKNVEKILFFCVFFEKVVRFGLLCIFYYNKKIDIIIELFYTYYMENQVENLDNLQDINYSVFNALNLACEDLGQQYLKTGFNPFGEDFELNEEYITDALLNNKDKPECVSPAFIEKGENATKEAFTCSFNNCTALLAEMESMLNNPTLSPEQKAKLKKIVAYLKMRIELLTIYLQNFKNNKNKLNMYQNILGLNYKYADMLKDSFEQNFDIQMIANQFFQLQKVQETYAEKASVIEQAKQIIANNLKKQETTSNKQEEKTEEINQYQQALNELQQQNEPKQNQSQHTTPQSTHNYRDFDDLGR